MRHLHNNVLAAFVWVLVGTVASESMADEPACPITELFCTGDEWCYETSCCKENPHYSLHFNSTDLSGIGRVKECDEHAAMSFRYCIYNYKLLEYDLVNGGDFKSVKLAGDVEGAARDESKAKGENVIGGCGQVDPNSEKASQDGPKPGASRQDKTKLYVIVSLEKAKPEKPNATATEEQKTTETASLLRKPDRPFGCLDDVITGETESVRFTIEGYDPSTTKFVVYFRKYANDQLVAVAVRDRGMKFKPYSSKTSHAKPVTGFGFTQVEGKPNLYFSGKVKFEPGTIACDASVTLPQEIPMFVFTR